jgi:hypothetical protein
LEHWWAWGSSELVIENLGWLTVTLSVVCNNVEGVLAIRVYIRNIDIGRCCLNSLAKDLVSALGTTSEA